MPCPPNQTLQPVAILRSCFGDKFAVPRQPGLCPSAWGELVFEEACRHPDAVRGLEGFSHLWLIFGFHLTRDAGWSPTVRPPRLGGNQRVGVFASRSTHRPNGLGLSLVRLESIDFDHPQAPLLRLGGVDLVDGTPIYDIKPYLPYAEALPDARAGYAADAIERLKVEIEPQAQAAFAALNERSRALICEALALDPRPAVQADDASRIYGAKLCGREVRFTIADGVCWVKEVEEEKS